jgi:hypothetical protein
MTSPTVETRSVGSHTWFDTAVVLEAIEEAGNGDSSNIGVRERGLSREVLYDESTLLVLLEVLISSGYIWTLPY